MTNYEEDPRREGLDDVEELNYNDYIMQQYIAINKLPLEKRRIYRPVVDYAFRRGYFLGDKNQEVDLWGFGKVPVVMKDKETETQWVSLKSLKEPTGLTEEELITAFQQYEFSDLLEEEDLIHIPIKNSSKAILMVTVSFAQLIFMEYSPWSSLFQMNINKLLLRGFYESGAYKYTMMKVYTKDDQGSLTFQEQKSMEEYFEENGVPSEEEAIHEAYRGVTPEVFGDSGGFDD